MKKMSHNQFEMHSKIIWLLLVIGSACLFALQAAGWVNIRANMAALMPTTTGSGGPHIMVCPPDKDIVYAWAWQKPPIKSTDGGVTWTRCGQDAGSAVINHGTTAVQFDPNNSSTFWECGMYGGIGLCKTTNEGDFYSSFNNSSGHCDGMWIDFSDPARKTILMGGHEQKKTVYKSADGGLTWSNIGGTLPGLGFSSNVYVADANTYLVIEQGWGGFNGLHRTTNGGATWTQINTDQFYGFPVKFSNGKLYWPRNNYGLFMSADNGATWTRTGVSGNRTMTGGWQGALTEMPGGTILTISSQNKLITSIDDGKTWTIVASNPINCLVGAAGVAYNKVRNCAFVWAEPNVQRYDFSGAGVSTAENIRSNINTRSPRTIRIVGNSLPAGITGTGLSSSIYDIKGRLAASGNPDGKSAKLSGLRAYSSYVVKIK